MDWRVERFCSFDDEANEEEKFFDEEEELEESE